MWTPFDTDVEDRSVNPHTNTNATVTFTTDGMINGAADFELSGNEVLVLTFDGINWSDIGTGGSSPIDALGVDHIHGLARWNADGGATFDLPDIAEYMEAAFDDGSLVEPLNFALTADGMQIVFNVAPAAASVVVAQYVILRI